MRLHLFGHQQGCGPQAPTQQDGVYLDGRVQEGGQQRDVYIGLKSERAVPLQHETDPLSLFGL
jgi:hypothetical protein